MQKVNCLPGRRQIAVFGCIVLLVVLVDQLSKSWIRANLAWGETLFDIGFFRIIHVQNTGVAFGMFKDHAAVFITLAVVAAIIILFLFLFMRRFWPFLDNTMVLVAMGMILGGVIGNNLIDRIVRGHVTDFLDFKVWPVFNVADSSGVVGAILIGVYLLFLYKPAAESE